MGGLLGPILLVVALSLDALMAAVGYGASAIRIPFRSLLVIAVVCSGALGISIWAGGLLAPLLPPAVVRGLGCGILALLGLVKLLEEPMKRQRSSPHEGDEPRPSLLSIYCSPNRADLDGSRTLSPGEAAALALALSLDGMAAGLGAGAIEIGLLPVCVFALLLHLFVIRFGEWLGARLAQAAPVPVSPLCGTMLLVLAACKLRA